MRTIIDKLRSTIENLPIRNAAKDKLPFIYADNEIQNIVLDNVEPPFVACVPIESAIVQDNGATLRERITIAVWFADAMCQSAAGDYNAEENEQIIARCKENALRWAVSLSPERELRLVSINGSMRTYLQHDAMLTGYMLNVTLEETDGISRCDL